MKEKEKRGEREEEGVKIGRPTIGRRSSDLIFFFFLNMEKKDKEKRGRRRRTVEDQM